MNNLGTIAEALAEGDFGLLADFDGTLSHIAPTPAEALISPSAKESLAAIGPCLKLVAVISGRSLYDIRKTVALPDIAYVGNHGLEMWMDGHREDTIDTADFRRRLSEVKNAVAPLLKEEGVFLEDKGRSATIHYRLSHNPKEVEDRLLTMLEPLGGLRFMRGKMSINIVPPLEINKGSIVLDIIGRFGLKSAVYLGDDVTDIDAFRALREADKKAGFKGFSVAVMGKEAPPQLAQEADYTLDGIEGVEAFLSWLRGQVSPAR